jgi:hypothetical protein
MTLLPQFEFESEMGLRWSLNLDTDYTDMLFLVFRRPSSWCHIKIGQYQFLSQSYGFSPFGCKHSLLFSCSSRWTWAKNMWALLCKPVSFFGLQSRPRPGLLQGAKHSQGFALWGRCWNLPPYIVILSSQVFALFILSHLGTLCAGLVPSSLATHRTLNSLGWKPLSFNLLRLDHSGLGKTGTASEGTGRPPPRTTIASTWDNKQHAWPQTCLISSAVQTWHFPALLFPRADAPGLAAPRALPLHVSSLMHPLLPGFQRFSLAGFGHHLA